MKSLKMSAVLLILAGGFAAQANKGAKLPECENVVKSCESAGFKIGDHKKDKKGVWVDCIGKVAKGDKVEGVSVAQADAQACLDARKANKKTK